MKYCTKGQSNQDEVNVRRIRGKMLGDQIVDAPSQEQTNTFTPDLYPDIEFIPALTTSPDFGIHSALLVVFYILYALFYVFFNADIAGKEMLLSLTFLNIGVTLGTNNLNEKDGYKLSADYMEKNEFIYETKRIAKDGKLGLMKNGNCKTILPCEYDDSQAFDNKYLVLTINGKMELYSRGLKKTKTPTKYTTIDGFVNGMCVAHKLESTDHLDTYVNLQK